MSQRRGRSTCSRSTLSVAIVIEGTSDRKLLSRICFGSSGRNGRKSDAPAMLTMLPKFALVVMKTYLSVLAKVCRPSRTPCASDAQVPLQQDDVGRLLGDVHRALHRDAHVRRVERGRVVDPVAQVADHVAGLAQRRRIRSFWFGSVSAKMSTSPTRCTSAVSLKRRSSSPVHTLGRCDPHLAAHPAGDETVVAGDDLQLHAELPELGDGLERAGLRRVLEQQEADEGHLLLVVLVDDADHRSRPGPRRRARDSPVRCRPRSAAAAGRAPRRSARCGRVPGPPRVSASTQTVEHVPQRALGDHRVPVRVGAMPAARRRRSAACG